MLFQGSINYWCREKHWRHMQNVALEGQSKYGNDPLLKFFYGYSLICEGNLINKSLSFCYIFLCVYHSYHIALLFCKFK